MPPTLHAGARIGLMLGAAVCVSTARAEAQEYCVACTEPTAVYRCIIEGARPGGRQPLQTLCVTTMAKDGGHGACKVKGGTVFDCDGKVKRIPWIAADGTQPAGPVKETANRPDAHLPPKDPNQPPRTVEEMAKRANEKTAEQFQKTNEDMKDQAKSLNQKLGDTTKKTWRCISTFFTRCTE